MIDSIFDNRLRFIDSVRRVYLTKKENPKIIQFLWLKTRPSVDEDGEISNGNTMIFVHLN